MKTVWLALIVAAACGKSGSQAPPPAAGSAQLPPVHVDTGADRRAALLYGIDIGEMDVAGDTAGAEKAQLRATKRAEVLGLTPATVLARGQHSDGAIRTQLVATKSRLVADHFEFTYSLLLAFQARLHREDATASFRAIEAFAASAAIPESVWRAPLDKVEASTGVDTDAFEALMKAIQAYANSL